jgi:CRISPR type I-E-associated protein CasB/Cse2
MNDYRELQRNLRWECRVWWRALNGINKDGAEDRDKADRQARAEFRRVGSIASDSGHTVDLVRAFAVEQFHDLRTRVAKHGGLVSDENIALATAALAHVDRDVGDGKDTAALLGEGDTPLLAEARFKRLIRTDDPTELLPQVIRAIKILGKSAPVGELGSSLLLWGPTVKKRWAFRYWQKPYEAVEATLPETEQELV